MQNKETVRKYMLHAQLDLLALVKFIDGDMEAYELPDVNGVKDTIKELQQFTDDSYAAKRIAEWKEE